MGAAELAWGESAAASLAAERVILREGVREWEASGEDGRRAERALAVGLSEGSGWLGGRGAVRLAICKYTTVLAVSPPSVKRREGVIEGAVQQQSSTSQSPTGS